MCTLGIGWVSLKMCIRWAHAKGFTLLKIAVFLVSVEISWLSTAAAQQLLLVRVFMVNFLCTSLTSFKEFFLLLIFTFRLLKNLENLALYWLQIFCCQEINFALIIVICTILTWEHDSYGSYSAFRPDLCQVSNDIKQDLSLHVVCYWFIFNNTKSLSVYQLLN